MSNISPRNVLNDYTPRNTPAKHKNSDTQTFETAKRHKDDSNTFGRSKQQNVKTLSSSDVQNILQQPENLAMANKLQLFFNNDVSLSAIFVQCYNAKNAHRMLELLYSKLEVLRNISTKSCFTAEQIATILTESRSREMLDKNISILEKKSEDLKKIYDSLYGQGLGKITSVLRKSGSFLEVKLNLLNEFVEHLPTIASSTLVRIFGTSGEQNRSEATKEKSVKEAFRKFLAKKNTTQNQHSSNNHNNDQNSDEEEVEDSTETLQASTTTSTSHTYTNKTQNVKISTNEIHKILQQQENLHMTEELRLFFNNSLNYESLKTIIGRCKAKNVHSMLELLYGKREVLDKISTDSCLAKQQIASILADSDTPKMLDKNIGILEKKSMYLSAIYSSLAGKRLGKITSTLTKSGSLLEVKLKLLHEWAEHLPSIETQELLRIFRAGGKAHMQQHEKEKAVREAFDEFLSARKKQPNQHSSNNYNNDQNSDEEEVEDSTETLQATTTTSTSHTSRSAPTPQTARFSGKYGTSTPTDLLDTRYIELASLTQENKRRMDELVSKDFISTRMLEMILEKCDARELTSAITVLYDQRESLLAVTLKNSVFDQKTIIAFLSVTRNENGINAKTLEKNISMFANICQLFKKSEEAKKATAHKEDSIPSTAQVKQPDTKEDSDEEYENLNTARSPFSLAPLPLEEDIEEDAENDDVSVAISPPPLVPLWDEEVLETGVAPDFNAL